MCFRSQQIYFHNLQDSHGATLGHLNKYLIRIIYKKANFFYFYEEELCFRCIHRNTWMIIFLCNLLRFWSQTRPGVSRLSLVKKSSHPPGSNLGSVWRHRPLGQQNSPYISYKLYPTVTSGGVRYFRILKNFLVQIFT